MPSICPTNDTLLQSLHFNTVCEKQEKAAKVVKSVVHELDEGERKNMSREQLVNNLFT